jgi:hypothetical protein
MTTQMRMTARVNIQTTISKATHPKEQRHVR